MDRFDPYLAPLRGEPPEFYDDAQPEQFDDCWVDGFINGLSVCEDGGATYLMDSGIELANHDDEIGEVLRELAIAWQRNPEAVAAVTGTRFFRAMKALAAAAFNNQ